MILAIDTTHEFGSLALRVYVPRLYTETSKEVKLIRVVVKAK